MPLTIGVVGLSHLGLVWSLGYASLGFKVIGFDTDTKTVADLNNGIIPVAEPKLPELLKDHRSSVTFSSNPTVLKDCS
ncbi:MAG: hypothetical protein Q7S98_04835, partial [Deltaproteobacteria bacterium]|nr:hypothetical protein [Deltaproteobacteria bacterium]